MLQHLKQETNYAVTENGAVAHRSTMNECLDFFGLAGAMRDRPADALQLFRNAFEQDSLIAIRLLFYFRDIRGGQGERQLFRNCLHWLATQTKFPVEILGLFPHIVEHGRWDDLYAFVDTSYEKEMFAFMKTQLNVDLVSSTPSLLAKWLKSINTSSKASVALGNKTRMAFRMTPKQYRKTLSELRARINVLETLMSAGRWEEIDFDKLPSKAGLLYKTAFYKRQSVRYQEFLELMKIGEVKAKSSTLYPYELVSRVNGWMSPQDTIYLNSAWENLPNYLEGDDSKSLAVIDVSPSMFGNPIQVSISLGLYLAERNKGAFHNHFFTFHEKPSLLQVRDNMTFIEKVQMIRNSAWGGSTNIEAVFDLLLKTAIKNNLSQEDFPETIYVISDMEFNRAQCGFSSMSNEDACNTLMEIISKKYAKSQYELPKLVFWNVNARQNQFPMIHGNVTLVSGLSPAVFTSTIKNIGPIDTMLDAIKKYNNITI